MVFSAGHCAITFRPGVKRPGAPADRARVAGPRAAGPVPRVPRLLDAFLGPGKPGDWEVRRGRGETPDLGTRDA